MYQIWVLAYRLILYFLQSVLKVCDMPNWNFLCYHCIMYQIFEFTYKVIYVFFPSQFNNKERFVISKICQIEIFTLEISALFNISYICVHIKITYLCIFSEKMSELTEYEKRRLRNIAVIFITFLVVENFVKILGLKK